jgi:hypothetical protein
LLGRLLSSGILWRDFSRPEADLYDDATQCEQLLREYFAATGFVLTHDADATIFRLYPPGEGGDGDDDGVKRLKARLSRDFVAAAIALRFLYTEALTGKRELVNEVLVISLEELSQAVVSLLAHSLPSPNADRLGLLRELRKHRIVRFNDGEGAGSMDMLLSVLRPVMSYVSDEALEDALAVAGQVGCAALGARKRDGLLARRGGVRGLRFAGRCTYRGRRYRYRSGIRARAAAVRISKLITWQWGSLESREWAFSDAVLLTGESGSGKSTLLDSIQTLLTAAHQHLVQFNIGQDESTQSRRGGKEPRTLAAYALGQQADGVFLRKRSTSYVALVFEPSESAGEKDLPFTALVGVEAHEDAAKATLGKSLFFIVRRPLGLAHLLHRAAADMQPAPIPAEGAVPAPAASVACGPGGGAALRGQDELPDAPLWRHDGQDRRFGG